ncbi:uncharacterized protein ACNLHF_001454 isoform 1-T4 [Anomaloglossus baeobatrachus]
MGPNGMAMDLTGKAEAVDEGDAWAPVQRERSYTTGSLSESSGLKRRNRGERAPAQVTEEKEPSNKRVKPVTKTLSASSAPQQVKVTPLKKLSLSIQRSIGSRNENRLFSFSPRNRNRDGGSAKKRSNKLWSETFDSAGEELCAREVKRQEVIFELMQGERMLVEDLHLVKKVTVSLPPPQSDMSNTYAVVNKKSATQGLPPGSKTLETQGPASSHVQYDNVRPRSSPATPVDQLYSTVVPKSTRTSTCVTTPSNPAPISSSYSLAGNPTPPETASVAYSQVNAPSAGRNQLPAPNSGARGRPGQSAARCVHAEQHYGHRRGLGPAGPQVRSDVRQASLRALVRGRGNGGRRVLRGPRRSGRAGKGLRRSGNRLCRRGG